MIFEFI